MASTRWKTNIAGGALMIGLMVGFDQAAGVVQAHTYDHYDNQVRWQRERTRQYAFVLGYHNAYTEGEDARQHGYRISYSNMPGYRNSMNGHLAWMGHPDTYRDGYRNGYEDGFKDGYGGRQRRYDRHDVERVLGDSIRNVYGRDDYYPGRGRGRGRDDHNEGWGRGRGRYDRNEVLRIAQQNGYREGFEHGQSDRARGRSFSYQHSSEYRNATHGYRWEYGDRALYQQGFRDGYRRGYEAGYRSRNSSQRRFPWPF
jgi:flagellar biosynthesis/type III secretory pathway protein FliH